MGKVYLVGAGPGDAGLLTVKGRRCIEAADAIVYDRLASPRLLTDAKPNVELYFVGKESDMHTVPQTEIEETLVTLAKRGLTVVRLKGGDPFVFGRGGEEAAALAAAGVPWEVVPGITSAVGVPAYAGIPVTYRNLSPSFTVVTGHRTMEGTSVDWTYYAGLHGTLVILMGVRQLDEIVKGLLDGGKSPDTPAAMIRWGTRAKQETLRATLRALPEAAQKAAFKAPCVIVIGEVAGDAQQLPWYEHSPLVGRRLFFLTSSQDELGLLQQQFEALGAETFGLTASHLRDAKSSLALKESIEQVLASIANSSGTAKIGLHFQSAHAVHTFFQLARTARLDVRRLANIEFAADCDDARHALAEYGVFVTDGICDDSEMEHHQDDIAWWREEEPTLVNHSVWIQLAREWISGGIDGICIAGDRDRLLQLLQEDVSAPVPCFHLRRSFAPSSWEPAIGEVAEAILQSAAQNKAQTSITMEAPR